MFSFYIANCQVKVYSFSQYLSTYTPLSGISTVAYASPWDSHITGAATQVTLPFTFTYDGLPHTQFYISPNGFITFGATQPTPATVLPLNSTTIYDGAISALGIDLISNGSDIIYQTIGTSPNRTMVVQWTDAVRKIDVGNFNFQIRLNEFDNSIELAYGLCSPAGTTVRTVQVGLRGGNNNFAQGNVLNRLQGANQVWLNNSISGVANNSTLRTALAAYPDLGLVYKYIPASPCSAPSAQPSGLVVGATSISDVSFVGNSFTAASPAPTNYLILRSTVNVPPTSAEIPDRTYFPVGTAIASTYTVISNSSATAFTQTLLLPDTTYYYWVVPYNDMCTGAPFYNLTGIITSSATTCSKATLATAATNIAGNSFDANWTIVPTATNYFLDVSTNNSFTALVPGYSNLSVGNVNTYSVTGLSSLTTYYYRVRAIGSGCVVNSNTITTSTICGYYPIPYYQNFDTTAFGALPTCFVGDNANADPFQWQTQAINVASAPKSLYITKNTAMDMDDWFFLPGLNLTGGISYRLFFRYNTGNTAAFTENLRVMLGNSNNSVAMTQTLVNLTNINNTTYQSVIVDFVPATNGVYFIGYQGYSVANQSYIVIDDVSVTISPTCFEPSDVSIDSVLTNSASISWTASFPVPANGYEYYVSTSSTNPNASTVPTGTFGSGLTSATISGLLPSTTYYFWIRGNCGPTDKSVWTTVETFSTECAIPTVLTTTPATRCGFGTVSLNATSSVGSFINWYDAPVNGNIILANNNNFTTPSLTTTTIYYAEAKSFGSIAKVGPTSPINEGGTFAVQNYQASVNFDVVSNTSLISIDIYPYVSGQPGQLRLRNSSNVTLATIPFTTSFAGGNTAQIIPINYTFAPGTYSLYFDILPAAGVKMNNNNAFYPYTSSVANITGNTTDSTFYLGFYNWKFTTECLSPRVAVQATVTSPPALTISSALSDICQGDSTSTITISGYGSYNNLVWSPNTGISGNFASGFTFNPTTTTTYTLLANQTASPFCGNAITHTVTVKPAPPAIAIIPNTTTICENTIQALNGSASASAAIPIYTANFNDTASDWTVANTSVGGNTTASQWTLYPDGYNYSSAFWNVTFHSNDNSQFFMANSDSQSASPGIITRTTLTSPSFSLAGYTSANLSYWHYLRFTLDVVLVEISTNGGTAWTTIKNFNSTQGTPIAFVNDNIDLSPYLGQTDVKIRFNFTSNWGYVWAINNFEVSGTLATALTWSPITNLYQDALATVPYVAGTPLSVVYSKPNANITYTASLTGVNGCSTSNTSLITVVPSTVGGITSANQYVCLSSAIVPITLTGNVGNILRWEYADDAAFTINVNTIVNTTNTLSVAQIGIFTSIRYFRAVVKNGICLQQYSNVVFVEYPSTTWNGSAWSNGLPDLTKRVIFNGNYSSTIDLSACSVVIQSGNITINSDHTFTIENDLIVNTPGTITFENNSSLVQLNDVVNTGNITYKRNTTLMKRQDYTYWSTPVFPQTLVGLSPLTPFNHYYNYNPIVGNWVHENSSNLMDIGKGYIIRAPGNFNSVTPSIFNGVFYGTPNNGTYTTPIQVSTSIFNLIGNPYPSALDADSFLSYAANVPVVDATIYLWTHNTPITANQYTSNDYAAYNYLGGVGTSSALNTGVNNTIPLGKIASGQSFFIKGLSNGSATFTNAMRIAGNNSQFFRMNSENNNHINETEKHRIWLDIVDGNNAYKQTLIGYSYSATYQNNDRGFDGEYIDSGNSVSLYSVVNSEKLTIQGRPLPFINTDEVPLGFKATTQGSFQINLYNYDGLFLNQDIYLRDNYLNTIHNLKQGVYNFVSDIGVFEDRFVLLYQSTTLNTNTIDLNNTIVLFKNSSNQIFVNSGNLIMKEIKVVDMQGRIISTLTDINSSEAKFTFETNQVLLFQIKTDDDKLIVKKYIN